MQNSMEVKGRKFLHPLLKRLKQKNLDVSYPASALATYILLNLECETDGTLDSNFKIKDLAVKSNIPYTTIYTGFQFLLKYDDVREVFVDGKPIYEITDYDFYNRSESETIKSSAVKVSHLNYFYIPTALIETDILAKLIKARNSNGIFELLNLIQNESRRISQGFKKKTERAMDTLRLNLKNTAKKARKFIEMISPIFSYQEEGKKVRTITKKNFTEVDQVSVGKYILSFKPSCIREVQENKALNNKVSGIVHSVKNTFKNSGILLTKKERENIYSVYKSEVTKYAEAMNLDIQKRFLRDIQLFSHEVVDSIKNNHTKVEVIGAYLRQALRSKWAEFKYSISAGDLHDMKIKYFHLYGEKMGA